MAKPLVHLGAVLGIKGSKQLGTNPVQVQTACRLPVERHGAPRRLKKASIVVT